MRWGLIAAGLMLLALAWAIWLVSHAHGHGTARGDRRMMTTAIVLGGLALAGAAWSTRRARRDS